MPLQRIAYFISPHGFGHAARACAVMEALHHQLPTLEFEIFTRAPRWFFETSLPCPFNYHEVKSDVGLVQRTPLFEDLPATLTALAGYIPFSLSRLAALAQTLCSLNCALVISDISPLGIAAAQAAGLPSVLVENFTWDWIYAGYLDQNPGFAAFIPEFQRVFASVGAHIQTAPVCAPTENAALVTNPVGRSPRRSRAQIFASLGIPPGSRMVLITMGGFELEFSFLNHLLRQQDTYFVVPGGSTHYENHDNLVLLPHHSDFYHPDLIHAADAVISKAGYSTIAEAYHAGIPFGYVSRDHFRESPILSEYIARHMQGVPIDGADFQSGQWVNSIPLLLALPRITRTTPNGADQIATFLMENY
jgi:hypothetical protein